jgi:hypothetical protein
VAGRTKREILMARVSLAAVALTIAMAGRGVQAYSWIFTKISNGPIYGMDGSRLAGLEGIYDGTKWAPVYYPGALHTWPCDILGNKLIGNYTTTTYDWQGFAYDGTTWKTLYAFGVTAHTNPVDMWGDIIIGEYPDSQGTEHGFLYDGNTWRTLDCPGAAGTRPTGIWGNKIVGLRYGPGIQSFLYDGSSWSPLAFPGARQTNVCNVTGNMIVGYYFDDSLRHHGFLYDGTTWHTVDFPGASSTSITDIDISGSKFVGQYQYYNGGQLYGFLATIPEPATLCLLALGGLLLARRRGT